MTSIDWDKHEGCGAKIKSFDGLVHTFQLWGKQWVKCMEFPSRYSNEACWSGQLNISNSCKYACLVSFWTATIHEERFLSPRPLSLLLLTPAHEYREKFLNTIQYCNIKKPHIHYTLLLYQQLTQGTLHPQDQVPGSCWQVHLPPLEVVGLRACLCVGTCK